MGIAIKVSDGDASRMGSELESTNRVRPAVVIEILRQLGVLSSEQEQALAGFGPEKSITNHRGIITGKSHPCLIYEMNRPQKAGAPGIFNLIH